MGDHVRRGCLSRRQALSMIGGFAGFAAISACTTSAPIEPQPGHAGAGEVPLEVSGTMLVLFRRQYFGEMEDQLSAIYTEWARENNIELEISTVASEAHEDFVATTLAQVEAGNPPDFIFHSRLVQQLYLYDALESVSDVVDEASAAYGEPSAGHVLENVIDGEWWGVPYTNDGGGSFARRDVFDAVGIDPLTALVSYMDWRDACLEVSAPSNEFIALTRNAASVYAKAKADSNPLFYETVVLNVPTGPDGLALVGNGGGGQIHIPRGAPNSAAAKSLALYMLRPENFLPISLVSAGLFLPAYANYYAMDEVIQAFDSDQNLQRMGEQTQGDYQGASWPAAPSPFFDAIAAQAILTDMMAETITQGATPAYAVARAAERIAQIAEDLDALG